MIRLRTIAAALTAIPALLIAISAQGTPHVNLCSTTADDYHRLVERIMREAFPGELEPLVIRYALPIWPETGIGIARAADGFHLVRLSFDRSLWYDSRVEPRVATLSIPVSDQFANALIVLVESLSPASESEPSEVLTTDGVSVSLFQMNGRCLRVGPAFGEGAAASLVRLFRGLENDMSEWRSLLRDQFEMEVLEAIGAIRTAL